MVNRKRDWKEQQSIERDRAGGPAKLRRTSHEGSERSHNPQVHRDRRSCNNSNEAPNPGLTVETMMMIKAEQPPPSPSAMTEPLDLPEEFPKKDVADSKFPLCLSDQILNNASIGIEYYRKFPEKLAEEQKLQQKKLQDLEAQIRSLHSEYLKCLPLKADEEQKVQKAEQTCTAAKEKLNEAEAKYAGVDKILTEKQSINSERLQRKQAFVEKRLSIEKEYYAKKRDRAEFSLVKLKRQVGPVDDETLKKLDDDILRLKAEYKTAKENETKFEGILEEAKVELDEYQATWRNCKNALDNEKSACDGLERSVSYYKTEALKLREKMNELYRNLSQARLEYIKVEKDLNVFHFIIQNESLEKKAQIVLSNPFVGLKEEASSISQGSLKN